MDREINPAVSFLLLKREILGKLRELEKRLRKWTPTKIERALLNVVAQEKDLLIDANLAQLMKGEDSLGNQITPPYRSRAYSEFKLTLNPAGVVDLKLTGSFHDKWNIKFSRWPLAFYSTDKKSKELTAKYGNEIYGVQKESLGEISQKNIKPATQEFYRRDVFGLQ